MSTVESEEHTKAEWGCSEFLICAGYLRGMTMRPGIDRLDIEMLEQASRFIISQFCGSDPEPRKP